MIEIILRFLGFREPNWEQINKRAMQETNRSPRLGSRNPVTGCYCDPDPEWQEYCNCWH